MPDFQAGSTAKNALLKEQHTGKDKRAELYIHLLERADGEP